MSAHQNKSLGPTFVMSAHQNKTLDPTLTLQTDTIKTKANNVVFNAPLVAQVATLQTGDSIIDARGREEP